MPYLPVPPRAANPEPGRRATWWCGLGEGPPDGGGAGSRESALWCRRGAHRPLGLPDGGPGREPDLAGRGRSASSTRRCGFSARRARAAADPARTGVRGLTRDFPKSGIPFAGRAGDLRPRPGGPLIPWDEGGVSSPAGARIVGIMGGEGRPSPRGREGPADTRGNGHTKGGAGRQERDPRAPEGGDRGG
ncbi:hypothetical protein GCM10027294_13610 [Marinactinospora endophytica]